MRMLILMLALFAFCGTAVMAAPPLPYALPTDTERAARKRQLLDWGRRWLLQYGRPFDVPAPTYPANVPNPLGDATANTLYLFALAREAEVKRAVEAMAQLGPWEKQYGIFQGPAVMEIWFRYRDTLPDATRARLLKEIEKMSEPGERLWGCCDIGYAGGNWGFCAAAGVGLAGEILGDAPRLARGKYALKLALEQIRRYGTILEYNTPTYYGPSFAGLAAISAHAKDAEFRDMARAMQVVLLAQSLTAYHPPTTQVSGPWQRGYHQDVYGGPSAIKALLYPYLPEPPYLDLAHLWRFPSMVGASSHMMQAAVQEIYFPAWLGMFLADRNYPWTLRMTSHVPKVVDRRGLGTEYPEGDINVDVYQTPVYTFGSASYVFHNGAHAETPWLSWSVKTPVRGLGDFKNGFFRMMHHDALVEGGDNESVFGKTSPGYVLWNEGRKFAYQHENRAILFAHPDRLVPETTRLGLSFFATELGGDGVDEVYVGDEKVTALPATFTHRTPVLLKDGRFYLALLPLPGNDALGAPSALEIRRTATRYLQISFLNYRGERRSMKEWTYARNGVYLEAGDTRRFRSFAAFRRHVAKIQLDERQDGDLRAVTVTTPDGVMRATYDRRAEVFRRREFNDAAYAPAPFASSRAAIGREGHVSVGKVAAACVPPQPLFLAADPARKVYVLLNLGESAADGVLTLPNGNTKTVTLPPYRDVVLVNP